MIGLLFNACNAGTNTLHIQTNVPALANLAGIYMMEPGTPIVEIEYREQLQSTNPSGSVPDLLVGTGLYSQPVMDNLASQKALFETDPITSSDYYPFTFQKFKDDYRLTVLAWDLPAIVSSQEENGHDFNESVLIPLEGLNDKAAQFNRQKKGSFHALGFSPLYSDEFMYLVFQYAGTHISADSRGYPEWNESGLSSAIQLLNLWSTSYNGGPEAESAFISKYAYEPVLQLLASQRLAFAYSRASDFLNQSQTRKLSLHWATWQGRLLILDNFVATGIPQQSNHKTEALQFIRWLLKPDVQRKIIVKTVDDGIQSFGFLGGFSSCRNVTEKSLPQYYPKTRLHIPPESIIFFPEPQGILWRVFKQEILAPWIRNAVLKPKPDATLRKTVSQWLLQMGLNP